MTYEIYRYIFIGGLILSIVMLVATVLIFFLMNIKTAIADITGSGKRKAIENIRNKNVETDSRKRTSNKYDYERQSTSARLASESAETSKISPQDRYDVMEASETTVLDNQPMQEVTVLNETENELRPVLEYENTDNSDFSIEIDITYVHSNEVVK